MNSLQATDQEWSFTDAEMMTAVGHLETHGYVAVLRSSAGEQHILLTPDLLVTLASSIVLLADKHPRELGAVSETELLQGNIPVQRTRRPLTSREPDFARRRHPALPASTTSASAKRWATRPCSSSPASSSKSVHCKTICLQQTTSLMWCAGALKTFTPRWWSCSGYTPSFTRINQWQNQAQYEMGEGEICGFRLIEDREGEIEVVLYYGDAMPSRGRSQFQELFEQFLYQRDVEVTRFPPVVCPNGHRQKRATVIERVREGKPFRVLRRVWQTRLDLPDFDEPQTIGIGASPWLQREEAAARLRSAYEVHLTKVKSYRRDWAVPRCYVSRLPEQAAWANEIIHDLRDAGVYVVEQAAQVQPDDFVIVLDTPAYQKAFHSLRASLADAPAHSRATGKRQLISLALRAAGTARIRGLPARQFLRRDALPGEPVRSGAELVCHPAHARRLRALAAGIARAVGANAGRNERRRRSLSSLKIFISYSHKDEKVQG